jgi:hypothetical protein
MAGERKRKVMKLVLLFAAATVIVALVKGILRHSTNESDSLHLLARPGRNKLNANSGGEQQSSPHLGPSIFA